MPKESYIQTKIIEALKAKGCYVLNIHGSAMQPNAVDLFVCYRGVFVAIEVKIPGKDATLKQQDTLDDIQRHGGFTTVAHNVQEAIELLDELDAKFRIWRKARQRIQRYATTTN